MPTTTDQQAEWFSHWFNALLDSVGLVIKGKRDQVALALTCVFSEGHLLLDDVPGTGKTSLAKAIAHSVKGTWSRIQFTPDLLPSDVTGVNVYSRAKGTFEFRPGGIFANIVLGDEINRASPKTQSALLEAMEERQVTVDATTYLLPSPFMVIATQNPIEHEGTYPLPESQLDRFLMRIRMGYPDRRAELEMLDTHATETTFEDLDAVAGPRDIEAMTTVARAVHVAPSIKGYLVDLADATRNHQNLALGISPRAVLAMQRAGRARAAALGREFVTPDDIKALAGPLLEHRLLLTPEASLSGLGPAEVLEEVLGSVAVPTGRG